MPDFTQEHFNQILDAARSNSESLAQKLESCFGTSCQIEATEPALLPQEAERPDHFQKGGLLIGMRSGNSGVIALLPESLPLPAWYQSPGETEFARLQTLGKEWSLSLFPAELPAEEVTTVSVDSLNEALLSATPDENTQWLPITVSLEGSEQPGTLYLMGPVNTPCPQTATTPEPSSQQPSAADHPTTAQNEPPTPNTIPGSFTHEERLERSKRVRQLPVKVTVRLADKRIEMTQLQTLSPGSLIMFNKNCEELLDLYVNNTPYCRGEVVKVGENFGLKVDEVGYHIEPEPRII